MSGEALDGEVLHLRLIRRSDGGISGCLGRPDGSRERFDGWLDLLALLQRCAPPPTDC